ncbi:uncharacterized protein N7459_006214 [Penicillium hispanicum]|uniref:uncharacterized protein n=1 Tax=Penicillium hispanicum TaxID=1080232 RepID=UPI002542440D|nr:uncharacterized protein N7459_006214 [Penicillium hispanicum]KAJ5580229.1 hypothetical protein N7459_006214 [Penicillium hispanicum]
MLFSTVLICFLFHCPLLVQSRAISQRADSSDSDASRALWRVSEWTHGESSDDSNLPPLQTPADPLANIRNIFAVVPFSSLSRVGSLAAEMHFYDDLSGPFSMGYMNNIDRGIIVLVTATEGFWAVRIKTSYERRIYRGDWHDISPETLREKTMFKFYVGVQILGQDNGVQLQAAMKPASPKLQDFLTELKTKNGKPTQLSVTLPPTVDNPSAHPDFNRALADETLDMLQKAFPDANILFNWIEMPGAEETDPFANAFGVSTLHGRDTNNPAVGEWIAAYYGSFRILGVEFPDSMRTTNYETSNAMTIDLVGGSTETTEPIDLSGDINMIDLPSIDLADAMDLDQCNTEDLLDGIVSIQLESKDGKLQPTPNLVDRDNRDTITALYNNGPGSGDDGLIFIVLTKDESWILPVPWSYLKDSKMQGVRFSESVQEYQSFIREYLGYDDSSSDATPVTNNLVEVLTKWKQQNTRIQGYAMVSRVQQSAIAGSKLSQLAWKLIAELTETYLGQKIEEVVRIRLSTRRKLHLFSMTSDYLPTGEAQINLSFDNKNMVTLNIPSTGDARVTIWDKFASKWNFNE